MSEKTTSWAKALKYAVLYWISFIKVLPTRDGLFGKEGRTLIWGKFRRMLICMVPPLAKSLHKKHDVKGGCAQCGTSCKILFTCPALDLKTNNCMVYDKRPNVCRLFPITPQDIRDRDIVASHIECGYIFPALQTHKASPIQNKPSQNPSSKSESFDLAS